MISKEYLNNLIRELLALPSETEWIEFKHNNSDPQMIGEYISALGNSATLCGRPKAYLIWGVNDETHKIEGTTFNYKETKKGAEDLELWLSHMVEPRIDFRFYETVIDNENVTLLEIPCAENNQLNLVVSNI